MRCALEISFDGKAYNGWQSQRHSPSVQATLENKLSVILEDPLRVTGCGRTDTGVHARQFVLHFDITSPPPSGIVYRLNSLLPDDIAAHRIYQVPDDFNARFDALSRTYNYRIIRYKDPFAGNYAYRYPYPVDGELLNRAADILKQYDEFGSFCKSKSQNKTNFCKILDCRWEVEGNEATFVIRADRFLRNMVRAIVGTLLEINEGKTDLEELHDIIRAGDRSRAGRSAPAQGLTLAGVEYDRSNWITLNDR